MTRRLRPEERARAVLPLSTAQRAFIDAHLGLGGSPAVIRDTLNRLSSMSAEDILVRIRSPTLLGGVMRDGELEVTSEKDWSSLAGSRKVTSRDVRRAYDRQRKSNGRVERSRELRRHEVLAGFANEDKRNAVLNPYRAAEFRTPPRRLLHDLGFAARFGASNAELEEIAGDQTVPTYLLD